MATSDYTPKTIEIQLTKGYIALINEQDADLLEYKWKAVINHRKCYACRSTRKDGRYITLYLHRVILERKLGYVIPPATES